MTACVFELCSAQVDMVAEKAAPGPAPEALRRVPQHQLGGHEELGLCPASLMLVPLSRYDHEQLDQQHAAIQRLLGDREKAARSLDPTTTGSQPPGPLVQGPEPYRPGRAPRPDDNPQWFKPNKGSSPRHHPPLQGFPPLTLVPTSGPYPPGGSPVPTAGEVRATLNRALQLIAEAQTEISTGPEDKLAQALQLLNFAKQGSDATLGTPQVLAALDKLTEASDNCRSAIEDVATYMGGSL